MNINSEFNSHCCCGEYVGNQLSFIICGKFKFIPSFVVFFSISLFNNIELLAQFFILYRVYDMFVPEHSYGKKTELGNS